VIRNEDCLKTAVLTVKNCATEISTAWVGSAQSSRSKNRTRLRSKKDSKKLSLREEGERLTDQHFSVLGSNLKHETRYYRTGTLPDNHRGGLVSELDSRKVQSRNKGGTSSRGKIGQTRDNKSHLASPQTPENISSKNDRRSREQQERPSKDNAGQPGPRKREPKKRSVEPSDSEQGLCPSGPSPGIQSTGEENV